MVVLHCVVGTWWFYTVWWVHGSFTLCGGYMVVLQLF